jgi:hypothetical protein
LRSLTQWHNGLKSKYTVELEALVASGEAVPRKGAEPKASRALFLEEETTTLGTRSSPRPKAGITNPSGVMQKTSLDTTSATDTDLNMALPLPSFTPSSSSPMGTNTDTKPTPTMPTSLANAVRACTPLAIAALAGHRSKAGPIAGGVHGVLVGFALFVWLFLALRRRQHRTSPRGVPLESGSGSGAGFGYADPMPRSRPALRAPFAHTPHAASVGTIKSFGAA